MSEPSEPTRQELDALPADRRLELLELQRQRRDAERERQRQSRHQWFNSLGIAFGVLFTAASLIATWLTLQTGQDELRTAKEGQVTDRYTKAVEQLGSSKRDVRLGAIYALERIAADSERDRPTVIAVLASFVREHDPAPDREPPGEPDTDVQAALTVLGRQPRDTQQPRAWQLQPSLDLHGVRICGAELFHANLRRADLRGAKLTNANLYLTDLSEADLHDVDLTSAKLARTMLRSAVLPRAKLSRTDLTEADLSHASLTGASLQGAKLFNANLTGADLDGADLRGADLTEAELHGAGPRF